MWFLATFLFELPDSGICFSFEDETYIYDQGVSGKGRLTGRSGKGWTSGYEYNAVGQITSETRTLGGATFITRYTYDKSGVLTAMTYPDGRTVAYAPNPSGQPLSAVTAKSGAGKTLAEGAAYKPFGPLSGFDMGNGMEIRKTFDQDYRLKTLAAGSVMNLSYIHYMNGMIREITNTLDPARSQFFTYDDLGRLKTANGVYGRMAWTYDNVGNRLTESRNGITESYAYKTGTNIIESVDGALTKTFVHDANGNIHHAVIQKTTAAAQVTSDYLYTSDGLRLTRTSNGLTTVYHYDLAGNLIGESGPDGGNFKAHVYFAGTRLATVAADGTVCYHHNNHLETPVMMTDDDGDVVWRADYKPFGKAEVASSSSVTNDFRFPGQVFDAETGYHYNWNRYYDSETGRYLTADPIGLRGGVNLYVYVGSDPIDKIDKRGLAHYEIGGGFSFSIPGYHFSTSLSSETCCDESNNKHSRTILTTCWGFSLGASIGGGSGPGGGSLNYVRDKKRCIGKVGDSFEFETGFGFSSALFGGASWSSSDPSTSTFITGLGIDMQFWSQCKSVVKQDVIMGRCCGN